MPLIVNYNLFQNNMEARVIKLKDRSNTPAHSAGAIRQKRPSMILIKCAWIRFKKALKSNELSIVRDLHPIDNAHAERKKESVDCWLTDSFLNMV
jgi:hypothetical protein